jgi:hypothetical protein
VHLRFYDTVALVPLLRDAHDVLPRVTSLDLDTCLVGVDSDTDMGAAMAARNSPVERELSALPFYVGAGPLSLNVLLTTIRGCRSLTNLSLANNNIHATDMPALCGVLGPLLSRDGDACSNSIVKGGGGRSDTYTGGAARGGALEKGGRWGGCGGGGGTLTALDLSYNGFGDAGAEELARIINASCSSHDSTLNSALLRALDLRGNNIGPAGATTLVPALSKTTSLTSLDLRSNRIPAETGVLLLKTLLRRPPPASPLLFLSGIPVQELAGGGLEKQKLSVSVGDMAAAEAAILTTLYLGQDAAGQAGSAAENDRLQAVAASSTLTALDVGGHRLKTGSVQYLLPLLSAVGVGLRELRLRQEVGSRNGVGWIGMQMLGHVMMGGLQLVVLDLANNNIGKYPPPHMTCVCHVSLGL